MWEQQDACSGSLRDGNVFLMMLETLWLLEGRWGREMGKFANLWSVRGKGERRMWEDERRGLSQHHNSCSWEGSAVGLFKTGCEREAQRKQLQKALKWGREAPVLPFLHQTHLSEETETLPCEEKNWKSRVRCLRFLWVLSEPWLCPPD